MTTRSFFCAVDCAPSEQLDMANLDQWYSLACVMTDSEEHLDALKSVLEAKCREITKNFVLNQYRSKKKVSAYARQVLTGTSTVEWHENSAVFIFSNTGAEIAAGIDQYWTQLRLSRWMPRKPKNYGSPVGPIKGMDEDHKAWETRQFSFAQGIPVIWMASCIHLLMKHVTKLCSADQVEWKIVSDPIAGDNRAHHDKGKLLVGCLQHSATGGAHFEFGDDDRDSALEMADTYAGIAQDCLRYQDRDSWIEKREKLIAMPHVHWTFGRQGPPFAGANA
ncbi:MAG: hypothetical protein PF961_16525 [Planctomycetota bacterium]|nr:hypothetical protein [Planctomycetota bacterium]